MIIKGILCFFILLILPILLGLIFTRFMEEKNNLLWAFVVGYLFEFASFEVIYLPLYFAGCSFKTVQYVWCILSLIGIIVSIVLNKKRGKEIIKETINGIKNMPSIMIIFACFLAIQIYVPVQYMQHVDPDDAFYLANSTTTIATNTMFQIDPYTGQNFESRPVRYSLSALTIYYAALSEILQIHPAIFQHTIWPIIAIVLEFVVYALIGEKLFLKEKEKLAYFLIILSFVYMFGFISAYTNFAFFAYRSWQGKSLIANLIIPAVWLVYLNCMKNEEKIVYWLIFLATMIAACFVTEMGVFLVPIEVGVLSFLSLLQEKKFLKFIKPIACCLPQIVVGLIYMILK